MCRQITTNQTKHHTQPQDDPQIPQPFFFLEFGRCRSKARSLHEHKLSKRRLYKDTVGPYEQANRSRITKKHTRPPNHDDPQIPQPDLRFVKAKKTQTRHTKGQGPKQKHPQKNDLPMDTAVLPLCHTQKHARINYPLRHSVKHRNRIIVYTVVSIVENCTWSRAYEIASLSILSDVRTCAEGHNAKDLDCPSSVDENVAVVVVPSTPPSRGGRRYWRSGRFADQV